MVRRLSGLVPLFAVVAGTAVVVAVGVQASADQAGAGLAVHEWGTFTSVAGSDGQAVQWTPLGGPSDLPCFVSILNPSSIKAPVNGWLSTVKATVRMETPVLYFYASSDRTVRVKVGFPQGLITEWYPQALVPEVRAPFHLAGTTGAIEWPSVKILPGAAASFPTERDSSHYYAARETDAAPVQVGAQHEKFLFYRGLASFPVPISARTTEAGTIEVENRGEHEISNLIVFENYGGRVAYQVVGNLRDKVTLDRPAEASDLSALRRDLQGILIAQGLYPREAMAMLETWRDFWFEEGTRLFYLVPQAAVDSILPLEIDPKPAQVARVFVGRLEVITPTTQDAIVQAIRKGDGRALAGYSRFLEPITQRILMNPPAGIDQWNVRAALRTVAAWQASSEASCR